MLCSMKLGNIFSLSFLTLQNFFFFLIHVLAVSILFLFCASYNETALLTRILLNILYLWMPASWDSLLVYQVPSHCYESSQEASRRGPNATSFWSSAEPSIRIKELQEHYTNRFDVRCIIKCNINRGWGRVLEPADAMTPWMWLGLHILLLLDGFSHAISLCVELPFLIMCQRNTYS